MRSLYFDGSVYDVDTDLEIFMELAANYRRSREARSGPGADAPPAKVRAAG
jgi:hypothetical protein